MEQPKEPGFYWARHRAAPDAQASPVRVFAVEGGDLRCSMLGDECWYVLEELEEWGPRIEPPGKNPQGRLTGRTAPLDTGEVLYETRWDDGSVTWVDGSRWPAPRTLYYRDNDAPR